MRAHLTGMMICLKFSTAIIALINIGGCESITDAGRPLPPTEFLWVKRGFSVQHVREERTKCSSRKTNPYYREEVNISERINDADMCMLKRGFTFVPHPNGWMNYCGPGGFPEQVGCKSARGEIESNQWGRLIKSKPAINEEITNHDASDD